MCHCSLHTPIGQVYCILGADVLSLIRIIAESAVKSVLESVRIQTSPDSRGHAHILESRGRGRNDLSVCKRVGSGVGSYTIFLFIISARRHIYSRRRRQLRYEAESGFSAGVSERLGASVT